MNSTESLDIQAGSNKQKRFKPLRKVKKAILGQRYRKGSESNTDEVSGVKTRSTSDLDHERIGAAVSLSSSMAGRQKSISVDDITAAEIMKSEPINIARSVENIANKMSPMVSYSSHRKDDDGLPLSPPVHSTTADVIENGLKEYTNKWPSRDSGNCLQSAESSDMDVEEDFFRDKWISSDKDTTNACVSSDADFDAIVATSNLDNTAARHKMAVKPKGKRPQSTIQQKLKASSPRLKESPSLPLVQEEAMFTMDNDSSAQQCSDSRPESSEFPLINKQSGSKEHARAGAMKRQEVEHQPPPVRDKPEVKPRPKLEPNTTAAALKSSKKEKSTD